MHGHAEALVVVIFPCCIGPGGDIKRYYLIELKWGWELTGKFFEVLGGFCVLQQEWNRQTRYVHSSYVSTQARLCWPGAVLGSGTGTHSIDWHVQSGGLHSVSGVAETQREIKKPLIVTAGLGGAVPRQAGLWTASLPGVPRAFVCVFLTWSLWVSVSSSLCLYSMTEKWKPLVCVLQELLANFTMQKQQHKLSLEEPPKNKTLK